MAELGLRVNGVEYRGWQSARVTRGIESVAGSFDLEVTDRWSGQEKPWPILEEDECFLNIGGQVVLTGYVDRRRLSYGSEDHSFSVAGRDQTGDLVDCSAELRKQWEFVNTDILTVAKRIASPFGIGVSLQAGATLPKPITKVTVDHGESAYDVIERSCRMVGLLPISDGNGNLVLTRPGATRATTDLREGVNIIAANAEFDATQRFRRYVVYTQSAATDEFYGPAAASIRGEATDEGVTRSSRVLIIRPESGATKAYAKRRAEWEATVRAAKAVQLTVVVQGWHQGDGTLWPINALVGVHCERLGVSGDLLITQANYVMDTNDGTVTELTLRRADAYIPQSVILKGAAQWDEIRGGVKK